MLMHTMRRTTMVVARRAPATMRVLSTKVDVATGASSDVSMLNAPLAETDPDLWDIMEQEKRRQRTSLVLIPSENFTSTSTGSVEASAE